ncbi:SusC/RagA family TonB-linked outer membrane protein [Chitinophaga sp. SYP-B3965]|uniref:SusC/RagA family TonB-linked outer membrane protein n=1 Tax=Chitinophaga sp. SYP-B3965 TaxID=2663120 RepID=UPI001299E6CB|nr:TonB-dependent receptor [Chitinophaga sp. SYP-B3965]MRG44130.1 SusC/RagA family TonB-linked outer membrane protein [Chitinophaga sp. SYP-B3965]
MNKFYVPKRNLQLVFASLVCCSCFFIQGNAHAETKPAVKSNARFDQTITGTVKDATTGEPLIGATIGVKGYSKTTSTDTKGAFSLSVPDKTPALLVSFIGYVTQEVLIRDRTNIDILLQSSATDLTQVVVVGYGTQNKKDITGAVKTLKSESFNKGIINNPQELLQGKIAGVNVTSASGEPGAKLGITIRGAGGVRGGNSPLFVIDGLPLDNSSTGGAGDPLNTINPQDIESMDVLKDASATAIYGTRGANGVIIITTKKGKAGASTLSLNSSLGFSKMARPLDVLTAAEFRAEVPKLGGSALDDKGGDTDWQKVVTRTAITQNYNLAMSGGADKLTYYASFGAQSQQGIIKRSQIDRYTGRFNATQRFLDDILIIDVNLGIANTKNERPPLGIGEAVSNNPTYPAFNADGSAAKYENMSNPILNFDLDRELTVTNRITGSISPSIRLYKGLVYKFTLGIDNSTATRDNVNKPNAVPLRDGKLETTNYVNRNTLIENYLTYTYTQKAHNLTVLAGHSFQKFFIQSRSSSINKFPITPLDPIYVPGSGQELTLAGNRPGGSAYENKLQSFFGRINYQYDERYLLTVSMRADGSTKFGANNKYGYFPSFSLGWRISEEEFMKNSPFSNLKLRGGYGETGNQEIEPKSTQPLFITELSAGQSYPLYPTGPYSAGTVFRRLANPDLQWEKSKQTNLGLDFGLLNGDLTGSIDVFKKVSSNILLIVPPTDPVQPAPTLWANIPNMTVTNKGIEVDLGYTKTISKNIKLGLGGSFSYITNKVAGSPYSIIPSGSAQGAGLTSATVNGYINGEAVGTYFLKEFTGFDANGISTFLDKDKDGTVTDKDRVIAGVAIPNVLYSFYLNVAWKGFDLVANFNGVSGNKIYDNTANANFYKLRLSKNVNVTKEAIAFTQESINNSAPVSTRYLKDGAFLRLNNLAVGYNFNTTALGISKWVPTIRLSATGQNLFVITKYDGYDPEVNLDRNIDNFTSYGMDYLSYPKARSFIISLNASF